MDLQLLDNQRVVPMLRTPVFRDLKIAGHTVRVHKAKARQAAIVATRLAESFGEQLLQFFATPEDELEESGVVSGDEKADAGMLKSFVAGGFMGQVVARLKELGNELGPDHIAWYFEHMLVGSVELNGFVFASLDEFDEANFNFNELLEVFWCAVELCIYPTSDDPGIADGKSRKTLAKDKARPASGKTARSERKRGAATRKDGQSVRMSDSSG